MSLIRENELNLDKIKEIFKSRNLLVELNDEDGFVQVKYTEKLELTVWISGNVIKMRIILLPREEANLLRKEELLPELATQLNQQAGCNGTVDVMNLLGITLEYRLTYKGGIFTETILSSGEMLVEGANSAEPIIKWEMRRFSA